MRRLEALRNVTAENGAFPGEIEAAAHLAQRIAERFEIAPTDTRSRPTKSTAAWEYWQYTLKQFGLQPARFGNRANAEIDHRRRIIINLTSSEWEVL